MTTVNIHEAKTNFSRLVERVSKGETIVIAKAGKPVAKIVPLNEAKADKSRRLGFLKGQFTIPDDFKGFMKDEIEEMFYGKK